MRDQPDNKMFNIMFDRLIPCVAGKKTFANRDKMVPIQDGGKVSVTDEAFTALAISNYWAKWRSGGVPKWTDTWTGNSHFQGWHEDAYAEYDAMCRAVIVSRANDAQRKTPYEVLFCQYAKDKYGKHARKRRRSPDEEQNSQEVYNELDL